jgi:hypothetical protein
MYVHTSLFLEIHYFLLFCTYIHKNTDKQRCSNSNCYTNHPRILPCETFEEKIELSRENMRSPVSISPTGNLLSFSDDIPPQIPLFTELKKMLN